jgi:hypothetical protein
LQRADYGHADPDHLLVEAATLPACMAASAAAKGELAASKRTVAVQRAVLVMAAARWRSSRMPSQKSSADPDRREEEVDSTGDLAH